MFPDPFRGRAILRLRGVRALEGLAPEGGVDVFGFGRSCVDGLAWRCLGLRQGRQEPGAELPSKPWRHRAVEVALAQGLGVAEGDIRLAVGEAAKDEGFGVVRAEAPWAHADLRVRVLDGLAKQGQVWLITAVVRARRRQPSLLALRMFSKHLLKDSGVVGRRFPETLENPQPAADEALVDELQAKIQ